MKKRMSQLLILIVAAFLSSTKAVATQVPLAPLCMNDDSVYSESFLNPHYLSDQFLCHEEEVTYPLSSPLNLRQCCTEEQGSDYYTYSDKNKNNKINDNRSL